MKFALVMAAALMPGATGLHAGSKMLPTRRFAQRTRTITAELSFLDASSLLDQIGQMRTAAGRSGHKVGQRAPGIEDFADVTRTVVIDGDGLAADACREFHRHRLGPPDPRGQYGAARSC